MPITINGTGTIAGISVGGLDDGIITGAELNGAQTGSAPIYGCRAWVNFNGTGTVAIRASGNVSSITDNGTGNYTINFTSAMPDANYSVATIGTDSSNYINFIYDTAAVPTTTSVRVGTRTSTFTLNDTPYGMFCIFR